MHGPASKAQRDFAAIEGPSMKHVLAHIMRRKRAYAALPLFDRLRDGRLPAAARLGFMPGFAYLAGLDPQLATPRRDDPRTMTPSGTISIGGVQAGIQCLAGPSGWHLLGRTPVRTYHPRRDPVFLVEPGDAVTFHAIDAREWDALDRAAEAGEPVAELISL